MDRNSSSQEPAERAMEGARPELVEPVLPAEDHAFVTKARHSAFYEMMERNLSAELCAATEIRLR